MITSCNKIDIEKLGVKLCLLLNCCHPSLTYINFLSFVSYRRTDLKQLSLLKRAWIWKNARSLSKDSRDSNRFVE